MSSVRETILNELYDAYKMFTKDSETIKNLYNQLCYLKHAGLPPNEIAEEYLYNRANTLIQEVQNIKKNELYFLVKNTI